MANKVAANVIADVLARALEDFAEDDAFLDRMADETLEDEEIIGMIDDVEEVYRLVEKDEQVQRSLRRLVFEAINAATYMRIKL